MKTSTSSFSSNGEKTDDTELETWRILFCKFKEIMTAGIKQK